MANLEVKIESLEKRTVYGLWKKSNDRTIRKDIASISRMYHEIVAVPKGKILPYFVLSQNYNAESKGFDLFVGSNIANDNLECHTIPSGNYAIITVRPKMGVLMGTFHRRGKTIFLHQMAFGKSIRGSKYGI